MFLYYNRFYFLRRKSPIIDSVSNSSAGQRRDKRVILLLDAAGIMVGTSMES